MNHTNSTTVSCAAIALLWAVVGHTDPATYAYVTVSGFPPPYDVGITVLNTQNNTVAKSIYRTGPGIRDWQGIAFTPDGAYAYVTQPSYYNTVTVIDTSTGTTVADIDVGNGCWRLAITPNGARAYVVCQEAVYVIDTATRRVVSTPVNVAGYKSGIAFTPDGSRAYVGVGSQVWVLDTSTNVTLAIISGPTGLVDDIAITPDGQRAYFSTTNTNGRVSAIDLSTNIVIARIPVGLFPRGIAITPDGSKVYAAVQNSHSLAVLDVATNSLVTTIDLWAGSPVIPSPSDVAISPDGATAYVVASDHGSVMVVDTSTNVVTAEVDVAPPAVNGMRLFSSRQIALTPVPIEIPPVVSGLYAGPNPIAVNTDIELMATADDSLTGNDPIMSADYSVDGDAFFPMVAEDGFFDGSVEVVTAVLPGFTTIGEHEICVRAQDASLRVSNPAADPINACTVRSVFDPFTDSGAGVTVELLTALPGGGPPATVEMTFDDVQSPGVTSVTATSNPTDGAPESPPQFKTGSPPVYYDVETTASFTGSVTLCFSWEEGQFDFEGNIALFHYVDGEWQDVTTSVDLVARKVCGAVTSFSPFALFERSYEIGGFFAPVDNQPMVNLVKAGASVPVKFSLGGDWGLNIMAAGYPASVAVSCEAGAALDLLTETLAAGNSGLSYDASTDTYVYVWKTDKSWNGGCRRLTVKLTDGSSKSADFQFQK